MPFPRDGEAARLYAHLNDLPPAPSLYVPEVSMALDDVVIRAMSKSPEDRYPSAGDLGRAALAAVRGEPLSRPEQTVATGAAATRTAETIAVPATEETATRQLPGTEADNDEQAAENRSQRGTRGGGGRIALAGGVLALVAAIVAVLALASGGGGSGPDGAGKTTKPAHPKPKAPSALNRPELIAKADAICTDSQVTYVATLHEYPEGEAAPSVPYSRTLAGISTRAVRKFNSLTPPASLSEPYREYVAAQERVKAYDRQALQAAETGDTAAYLAARQSRDDETGERYDLARSVGLRKCSANR